ncbi:hypothetical protein DFH09DRAFT_1423879 [Mycena vulgaris]|nr:hypothetical protein DFH09DRAFT_1423879 [Mycena vulgaris]
MSDPAPDTPRAPSFSPTYPFDDAPAETILRSSDGAEFHVHRAILSVTTARNLSHYPVIDVDETGAALDRMLRLIYPATQPVIVTMDELRDTIQVALMKYDMHVVVPTVVEI